MWKYARNPWAVIWEQRRRLNALIKCLCLHNPSSILLSIHTLQFAVASWGAGFHHQPFQRYKLWYILSSAQQSASLFVMRQKDVWVRVCIWANPLIRSPIKCYRKSITTNKNSLANCAEMCNTFGSIMVGIWGDALQWRRHHLENATCVLTNIFQPCHCHIVCSVEAVRWCHFTESTHVVY